MKVIKEVRMPREDFFNLLKSSIEYDMKQHTNQALKQDVQYVKTIKTYKGAEKEVVTSIVSLTDDRVEFFTATDDSGIRTVYALEDTSNGVSVDYSESLENAGFMENLNYQVMSFIYNRKNKKKIENQLISMERYFLESK